MHHQVFVLLLPLSRNGLLSHVLVDLGRHQCCWAVSRFRHEVVADAVRSCSPRNSPRHSLPFVTLPRRRDPELCDVVRASEACVSTSASGSVQSVSATPVAATTVRPTAAQFPVTPSKPASAPRETEMRQQTQQAEPPAEELTIPNTPIEKL
jgi:hypothetical protein